MIELTEEAELAPENCAARSSYERTLMMIWNTGKCAEPCGWAHDGKAVQLGAGAIGAAVFLHLPTQGDHVLDGLDNCRNRSSEKLAPFVYSIPSETLVYQLFNRCAVGNFPIEKYG